VAAGDVNGDGAVDVITAPGTSTEKVKFTIRALDVLSGATLLNFQVNPVNRDTATLNLSAGDLDGDGLAEIMLATNRLHLTDLQTFKNGVLKQVGFPFAANLRTDGVSVATKDVTGDGIADFIFASSQRFSPRLRIVNGATGLTILNALLLGDKDRNGLIVG